MKNSGIEWKDNPKKQAKGNVNAGSGNYFNSRPNYTSWAFGSGDIYSTVKDLYKWDQGLYSDDYVF